MEYNDVRHTLATSPDLAGLDEVSAASLFWRGHEQTLAQGTTIYAEGAQLDDTFCLLLSGDLLVQKAGTVLGRISAKQIFGEIAYFSPSRTRTATIRVGSPHAAVLRIYLTPEELGSPRFAGLRRYLGQQAWDRFVSGTQNQP